jgi:hypothetical protein
MGDSKLEAGWLNSEGLRCCSSMIISSIDVYFCLYFNPIDFESISLPLAVSEQLGDRGDHDAHAPKLLRHWQAEGQGDGGTLPFCPYARSKSPYQAPKTPAKKKPTRANARRQEGEDDGARHNEDPENHSAEPASNASGAVEEDAGSDGDISNGGDEGNNKGDGDNSDESIDRDNDEADESKSMMTTKMGAYTMTRKHGTKLDGAGQSKYPKGKTSAAGEDSKVIVRIAISIVPFTE